MTGLLIFLAILYALAPVAIFFIVLGISGRMRQLETQLQGIQNGISGLSSQAADWVRQRPAERSGIVAEEAPAPSPPPPVPEPEPPVAAAPEPEPPAPPEPVAPEQEPVSALEPEPPAAVVLPSPPPPLPPPASAEPGAGLADLEKRFGTQWVVWVGGLALALGGIFLVRFSIEQGYFGPGARIAIGALLALALVGAGEWTRRQELRLGAAEFASAHIPGILTAAGTTIGYATVYGAYALYGFLGPAAAFVLLGIVALATLAAALVHGPALAGLGLIGAYVTPMLVSTAEPNYWALYIYLTVVTAAALALARLRLWRWLALTAVAFGVLWVLVGIDDPRTTVIAAHAFYAAAGFVLAAVFVAPEIIYGPEAVRGRIDGTTTLCLGGYLLAGFLVVLASRHDLIALTTFAVLVAASVAIALRTEGAAGAMAAGAVMVVLIFIQWADFGLLASDAALVAPGVLRPPIGGVTAHLMFGAGFGIVYALASFFAQARSARAMIATLWAGVGVVTPILILIALYYRAAGLEPSIPFAAVALLMAALGALAAEAQSRREPYPGQDAAGAILAAGAIAALALALSFALERGWLTVGLALMVPGIAWVAERRPLPVPLLRWACAAVILLVLARVAWEPRIVGDNVGSRPILNWLLWGYGVPAVSFWLAGHLLRRRADDVPARMADSAAILFTMLLAFLQIRHLMNGGDIYRHATGLGEMALHVCSLLAMTIGLEHVRKRSGSIVHEMGSRITAALAFALIVFGLAMSKNPMFTGDPVGGPFFNDVLLGYLLPAILMALLARMIRYTRPQEYYVLAAVTAIVLALTYLTFEVRVLFHGPVLPGDGSTDAEQYTYSAVWLAFGVALLLTGIALQSQPARLASAAVVSLTAVKVFLYDLAGVQGIYRAFSFIGLGLVLIGIGLLYQRLLFRPARAAPAAPGE